MGIRSLKSSSISTGTKRSKVWDQSAVYSTTAYESIATINPSGATNLTFSSIPSTYKHLQVRFFAAKSSPTNWVSIQLNGDTTANYSSHTLYGNGSTTGAGSGVSTTNIQTIIAPASTTTFGTGIVDILDYQNTNKNKVIRSLQGYDLNGSGEIYLASGSWMSTAAITSIKFLTDTAFSANTSFALYGIKG